MPVDDLCEMYVNGKKPIRQVIRDVAAFADGDAKMLSVTWRFGTIDVRPNEDYDRKSVDDSFLFFPFLLTFENELNLPFEDYTNELVAIANRLKETGYTVVAACHFEELFE